MKRLAEPMMLAAMLSGLLSGCAVGPDYRAPAAPDAPRYTAEAMPASAGTQRLVEGRDIPAEWWQLFGSAPLDALLRRALSANPDLQAATAALRVAHENVLAQQGAFLPSVDAQYSATRQGVAPTLASPLASNIDTYTLHTAQLSIGYVPDVFGANHRQVESLQAEADGQRYALLAAHLTLASNLVQAVIQQAATRAQIDATQQAIALATRQLELLRLARSLGQNGSADVAAQEGALAQLQATLPPLDKQLAQLTDQLAALVGTVPSVAALPAPALDGFELPGELPLSLPSKLVEQRPDILAADAALHAASAQIGVAVANRLPSFSLTAGAGSAALSFSQLFGAGAGFWSLGANVTQPIFEGGMLLHRQRAAEAGYAQAAAQYRSTVLAAFQNVADTLHAIDADARALDAATAAEQAAERSYAIARQQHAAGAVGMLAVLGAEQAWREAALPRIQARAARLVDSVALFQALGGGWWNRPDLADAHLDAAAR